MGQAASCNQLPTDGNELLRLLTLAGDLAPQKLIVYDGRIVVKGNPLVF